MEEKKAQLVSHIDTTLVTLAQLQVLPTPESTRYWRPIRHASLVETLKSELADMGFVVSREQFALGGNGAKLFGALDLANELVPGVAAALGFRHSNDKRIAIQVVAGGRVFVCDNMALSGDVTVLRQKHTWSYSLRDIIRRGLNAWQNKQSTFVNSIERMQNTPLSTLEAQALLAKCLYDGVTTFQTFKIAYDLYFDRAVDAPHEYPDCAPRTAWGLHNAYTRALKLATPNAAFSTTVALGKVFGA